MKNFFKTRVFIATISFVAGMATVWVWQFNALFHVFSPLVFKYVFKNDEVKKNPFENFLFNDQQLNMTSSDLVDEGHQYVWKYELEGLKLDDFSVNAENRQIQIKGVLKDSFGSGQLSSQFHQEFPVPEDADVDNLKVETTSDQIQVIIPKK